MDRASGRLGVAKVKLMTTPSQRSSSLGTTLFEVGEIIEQIQGLRVYEDIEENWIRMEERHAQMEIEAEYGTLHELCHDIKVDSPEYHKIREHYPDFEPKPDYVKQQPESDAFFTQELEPIIYATSQLAKLLRCDESKIRRQAQLAAKEGDLPQELPGIKGYFVVMKGNPKGGQGCGWRFKKSCLAKSTREKR